MNLDFYAVWTASRTEMKISPILLNIHPIYLHLIFAILELKYRVWGIGFFFLLKLFCHFLFFSKKCFKDYKVLIFGKSQFDQEKTWKFIKWRDASKCWLNEVPTTVKWFFYYENIWNGKKYQKKVWKAKLHLEAHPQCLSLRFCQT